MSRDLARKIFTEQELVSLLEKLIHYRTQPNTTAIRNKIANIQRNILDITQYTEATVVRHIFGNNPEQGIATFTEDTGDVQFFGKLTPRFLRFGNLPKIFLHLGNLTKYSYISEI